MTQNRTGKTTKTLNCGECQEIMKRSGTTTTWFTSHIFAIPVLQLCNLRLFRFISGGSSRFEALNCFSLFLTKQLKAVITIKSKLACPPLSFVLE